VLWGRLFYAPLLRIGLIALFLLTDSLNAVTIVTVAYVEFPRPETRFTPVVMLLLVYAVLTRTPLVFRY